MPIAFTCPHCGHFTNVDDQYAGRSGPCGNCGNTITIPYATVGHVPRRRPSNSSNTVVLALVIILGLTCLGGPILVALLLPAVQAAREAARRSQCTNNLKQIGIALHNYHDTYGCFPPAVITDEDGNPRYSWRVAILPFIEQAPLFDAYDCNVAWDDPANQFARNVPIMAYQCSSDVRSLPNETNYVMITGAGTVGALPNECVAFRDIVDGLSNTIVVVEVVDSGIEWSEPRDLTLEELSMSINDDTGASPSSRHPGGINVLMCDGSVHFLSNTIDPGTLDKLMRINDGNPVSF